jgi:peptidoglycan hydrolase-like protein with peptidoglycan-binding domain
VKEIQQALGVQVDGFFGAKTEQAVKEFQTAQSLEADGIVGPRTRVKLIPTEKNEVEKKDGPADRPKASWWLARGAMGDAVKEIQKALGIQADGFFGAKTEQAVKEFQAAQSLDADGIVGPRTRAKIIPAAEKKEAPSPAPAPSPSAPEPQSVPQSPALTQLINMGFPDINLNAQLLKKHNGDVEQVVAELLGA